jgi:hypothetical protein
MKNKTWKILVVLLAVLVIPTVLDCGGHSSPPPTTGFYAQGQNVFAASDGSIQLLSGTTVQGFWEFDEGSAQGSNTNFGAFTNPGAYYHVDNGRVPARWRIFPVGACIRTTNPERDVTANSKQIAQCLVVVQFLAADPSSIDLASPPPVVTLSGGGFDATYGMPVVEYFDQYSGALIASTTAASIASDGSSVQVYTPNLSGVYTASYNIVVSNVAWDGSNSTVGVANFYACCVDPPPPDPPPDPPPCGEGGVCEVY